MPVTVLCISFPHVQVHAAQKFHFAQASLQAQMLLDRDTIKFLDETKKSASISTKTCASSNTKTSALTSTNSEPVHPSIVTSGAARAPLPCQPHATPTLQLGCSTSTTATPPLHRNAAATPPPQRSPRAATRHCTLSPRPSPHAKNGVKAAKCDGSYGS